uniref:GH3 auxin-responsive promoter n=1 Tax=Araucaria cunninghamii TaxID=56994 RepID=A0A0D6R433_ARACU
MPEMQNKVVSWEQVMEEFEAMSKDAERVQRETLKKILERNAGTEYLQKWGLEGRTDPEDFKACVPLVTHADLEPYIQRIADGEESPILTTERISVVSMSSGTTNGMQKYVPWNNDLLSMSVEIYRVSAAYRTRLFPIRSGGRVLEFNYSSKQFNTKGGLVACTATTNLFRDETFKINKGNKVLPCSPDEVLFGYDARQSLYCHLLCGLIYSNDVEFLASTFAYSIVDAFRHFEQVWQELCKDIKEGKLSDRITVPSMRASVSKLLKPDPDLADEIHEKCKNMENWYGVIPQLWPNAKYIHSIMTGSMEPYVRKLRHYAGNLPLISADYGATEGWIGANIDPTTSPEDTIFTVVPSLAFFEFIPLQWHQEDWKVESEPVGLTEVKVGQIYEVAFTTAGGLYRYRLGDVVRVSSFYNSTPQLSFVCRKNLLLTVNIDKTTEKDLQISVQKAVQLFREENVELLDFTSYADMSTDPGHYVIFWELSDSVDEKVLNKCCTVLDESFVDPGYVGSRKAKTIGPLELRIVEKGTFQKILDHYLSIGAVVSQFKTPRCIKSNQVLFDILNNGVIQTYFSTFLS